MKRVRQEGRETETLPLEGREVDVKYVWNRRTKGGEREGTNCAWEREGGEGEGTKYETEKLKQYVGERNESCNRENKVSKRVLVEKALSLGFMVELNL